jgi:hypothetical protein
VTGSDDLASKAERLAAHCDVVLYRERNGETSSSDLLESARQLFQGLGRVKIARQRGMLQSQAQPQTAP